MFILYLHGYGSSGQNNTVEYLEKSLQHSFVFAPDIPVDPAVALPYLRDLCEENHFDIIIGINTGAMYAHQLPADNVRICINPVLYLSQLTDILKPGTFDFSSPRKDGQTKFTINEEIIEHYRDMEMCQFDNWSAKNRENLLCIGLFGTEDTTVNCREEFQRHYPNVQTFKGRYRMNQNVLKNMVLPIIFRFKEEQQKAELVWILENCLRFCPKDYDACQLCQKYEGYTYCTKEILQFEKRYCAEKEWQRLLQEGLVAQPKEKEPAIHIGDRVYVFSPDFRQLYDGKIKEIVSYTDKNHYEAIISIHQIFDSDFETRIVMDGLFDAPRVSLGDKSFHFAHREEMEQLLDTEIEKFPSQGSIAPMVFIDKVSAGAAAEENFKIQIRHLYYDKKNIDDELRHYN